VPRTLAAKLIVRAREAGQRRRDQRVPRGAAEASAERGVRAAGRIQVTVVSARRKRPEAKAEGQDTSVTEAERGRSWHYSPTGDLNLEDLRSYESSIYDWLPPNTSISRRAGPGPAGAGSRANKQVLPAKTSDDLKRVASRRAHFRCCTWFQSRSRWPTGTPIIASSRPILAKWREYDRCPRWALANCLHRGRFG